MNTKQCSRCKMMKPLTDFWVNRRNKDGRMRVCKACYSIARKKAYRDNIDARRAAGREYYASHREYYLAYQKGYGATHREELNATAKTKYRVRVRTPRIIAELEAAGYTVTPPADKATRQTEGTNHEE